MKLAKKQKQGVVVVLLVAAVLAGLGYGLFHGSRPSPMNHAANAVATNNVTISNYMFSPMSIRVRVGTTVTWKNTDPVNHTITADNSAASTPSSNDIAQGKSYSYTFTKAGTYTYHCFPHPYMHGTVEVTE